MHTPCMCNASAKYARARARTRARTVIMYVHAHDACVRACAQVSSKMMRVKLKAAKYIHCGAGTIYIPSGLWNMPPSPS